MMHKLLKLEEIGLFALSVLLFSQLGYAWYVFPLLLLAPDIGMLGYLINTKVGALTYNALHHRLTAVVMLVLGVAINLESIQLAGIVILAHGSLDRVLGYGLKYTDSFKHTHLGRLD